MSRLSRGLPPLALIVVTTLLLVFALKLPLSRLDVPYTFSGDAVEKLTQIDTVAETGWLFHNPRLGYPFGYDRLDFPRFDSLNYAIMGPIAALTGESGLAMNLYFIAGFYLIGLIALYAFRRLGLSDGPALLCALVYAFLPYHVLRGEGHLTNGAYFLVPLAILVVAWVSRGDLDPGSAGARRRWWLALAVALLLPLQMPYNGVFFALLCGIGCVLASARLPHWRSLWPAFVLVGATACSFLAEQAPALLHKAEAGANVSVAGRSPEEAELYALRLNQVLLPPGNHRLDRAANAKRGFDAAMNVPENEFRDQYLGLFGILGLAALAWALVRAATGGRRSRTDLDDHVHTAALLAIGVLLLAMSSGVLTLLAYWVTSKIRATNRIYPFLAFVCLIGSGWLLQSLLARIRLPIARYAALGGIGVLALLDVTAPVAFGDHEATAKNADAARVYFRQVEQRLGPAAAIFQLPAVWYPEHPPIAGMTDYEEFKPYLYSDTLRFSYGSAQGRRGYAWASTVAELAPAQLVERTRALGFSAILIDSSAYDSKQLAELAGALGTILPDAPMVDSERRWPLFPLPNTISDDRQIRAAIDAAFTYIPDGTRIEFGRSGYGGFYRAGGWADLEQNGVWSLDDAALLRMQLRNRQPGIPLALDLDASVLVGPLVPTRRLVVEANGHVLGTMDFSLDGPAPSLRFILPPDLIGADDMLELRFSTSPVASPRSAGISIDGRRLGIYLAAMSIAPARADP